MEIPGGGRPAPPHHHIAAIPYIPLHLNLHHTFNGVEKYHLYWDHQNDHILLISSDGAKGGKTPSLFAQFKSVLECCATNLAVLLVCCLGILFVISEWRCWRGGLERILFAIYFAAADRQWRVTASSNGDKYFSYACSWTGLCQIMWGEFLTHLPELSFLWVNKCTNYQSIISYFSLKVT